MQKIDFLTGPTNFWKKTLIYENWEMTLLQFDWFPHMHGLDAHLGLAGLDVDVDVSFCLSSSAHYFQILTEDFVFTKLTLCLEKIPHFVCCTY